MPHAHGVHFPGHITGGVDSCLAMCLMPGRPLLMDCPSRQLAQTWKLLHNCTNLEVPSGTGPAVTLADGLISHSCSFGGKHCNFNHVLQKEHNANIMFTRIKHQRTLAKLDPPLATASRFLISPIANGPSCELTRIQKC